MLDKLTLPDVRELLAENSARDVGEVLSDWLPADVAAILQQLDESEQLRLITALRPEAAAATFEYVDDATQERLLHALPEKIAAEVVNGMAPDDRTALFERVSPEMRHLACSLLTPDHYAVTQKLLSYPEDSVGRRMTPEYVVARLDWTVGRTLDYIRAHGKDRETLNVFYIVDDANKLIDDVRTRELLVNPLDKPLSEIADGQFVALSALDPKESAVAVFRKYDRTALPVIDGDGKLVGIVTVDDVLDIAAEQATKELQQFGGLEALDAPYSATPLWAMVKKRATWLIILFVGEMLTATAMGYFEEEISRAVVLALFVPLIISSGGNSGSQAATLIVRALALNEIKLSDWAYVMRRELISGALLGLILGTIGFLRIALWTLFTDVYGPHWALVALTVGCSLVGVVLWGSLSGSMLPFALKKAGLDPATSSAPFVATLVDVTGLIIYFSAAFLILSGTLL